MKLQYIVNAIACQCLTSRHQQPEPSTAPKDRPPEPGTPFIFSAGAPQSTPHDALVGEGQWNEGSRGAGDESGNGEGAGSMGNGGSEDGHDDDYTDDSSGEPGAQCCSRRSCFAVAPACVALSLSVHLACDTHTRTNSPVAAADIVRHIGTHTYREW